MVDKITDNKLAIINLYRADYLAQYHVREIAVLTKTSHVTLLPHLKALEQDSILTATTVGKNKVYSLRTDNIVTKNYVLLAELATSTSYLEEVILIKRITKEILNLRLSGTVVLFGSYAKGTFNKESDIDILHIGSITEEQIRRIRKLGAVYNKTINIKKTTIKNFETGTRKKNPLLIEIIKHHILLQHPEAFINALWRYYNEIKR